MNTNQDLIVIDPALLFAGLVIGLILLLVLLLFAATYRDGYDTAKKEAATAAAETEQRHRARVAVAGLEGMRHDSLRRQLDHLSQEHLRHVADLTREQ